MAKNTEPLFRTLAFHTGINITTPTGLISEAITLVSSVTGKSIQLASYHLMSDALVTGEFSSDTNNRSGPLILAAQTLLAAEWTPYGHISTAVGEALILNLSGTNSLDDVRRVGGHITWFELD